MGLFKKFTKIAKNIINDPWPTIGTIVGAATGNPFLAAAGNAVGNFASQGPSNFADNIGQNLLSAGTAGAGTYLAGGGLSDLLSGTSLGSGMNSLSNSLGFGNVISPAAETARSAISSTATSAAPSSSFLSGYLPSGGAAAGGGGSQGGFFSSILGTGGDIVKGTGMEVGKVYEASSLPWLGDVARGAATANPFTSGSTLPWLTDVASGAAAANPVVNAGTGGLAGLFSDPVGTITNTVKSGADDMMKPKNLLKFSLSSALQKDNTGGYNALRGAAQQGAANYQPYLETGAKANQTLSDLFGLNGADAATAAAQGWENTPGYQFARDQGIKALDASAASRGMLRSGNQEQAIQSFGTGLAQQYFQQYLNNLIRQQQLGLAGAQGVGEGNMDAALALAALKGNKATNFNNALSGLLGFA